MVTGELKNKIDGLWDVFATGGLTNPLEVIEQITYLMFIHDLDVTDNKKAKDCAMLGLPFKSIFSDQVQIGERSIDGQQLKWSVFRDLPANKMYEIVQEWVFPFIKNLHSDKNSAYSKYMDDAIFKLPTPLVLSRVIDSLDDIYALMSYLMSASCYEGFVDLKEMYKEAFPYGLYRRFRQQVEMGNLELQDTLLV